MADEWEMDCRFMDGESMVCEGLMDGIRNARWIANESR